MNEDRIEQLAILLDLVGDETANLVIGGLETAEANEVKRLRATFKADPPSKKEVNSVLEDFERFFSFALDQIQADMEQEPGKPGRKGATPEEDVTFEDEFHETQPFPRPRLSGDSQKDLNLLHPYQIAHAVMNDSPKAIAVVIGCLSELRAARTLELLPPEKRLEVVLVLTEPINILPRVERQILDATLAAALKVEQRIPEADPTQQLVTLMRSVNRNTRVPILARLLEENEEMGQQVKSQMYQFNDILRLGDRDVQKVLAESDSDSLVTALVNADKELREKILGNMSRRARQTIEEELEYKGEVLEMESQDACRRIVEIIIRLDESGEISLK